MMCAHLQTGHCDSIRGDCVDAQWQYQRFHLLRPLLPSYQSLEWWWKPFALRLYSLGPEDPLAHFAAREMKVPVLDRLSEPGMRMTGMLGVKWERMAVAGRNIGLQVGRCGPQEHRRRISELRRLECLGADYLGISVGSRRVEPAGARSTKARRCRRTNKRG